MKNRVLDVCCGSRMFWFDKSDKRAVYMDIRKESHRLKDSSSKSGERTLEVSPDIIASFESIPYPDESFRMVIFDPPHLTGNGENGWLARKYGKLGPGWESMIRNGFQECFRVLCQHGTLIFKWNETDVPVSKILSLTDQAPLVGNRCGKRSKSHWIVFMKGRDCDPSR